MLIPGNCTALLASILRRALIIYEFLHLFTWTPDVFILQQYFLETPVFSNISRIKPIFMYIRMYESVYTYTLSFYRLMWPELPMIYIIHKTFPSLVWHNIAVLIMAWILWALSQTEHWYDVLIRTWFPYNFIDFIQLKSIDCYQCED